LINHQEEPKYKRRIISFFSVHISENDDNIQYKLGLNKGRLDETSIPLEIII
jgi:hypothetical protein